MNQNKSYYKKSYDEKVPVDQELASSKWQAFVEKSSARNDDLIDRLHKKTPAPVPTQAQTQAPAPNSRYYIPTQQQLDEISPTPIVCFCGKPAHKSYTVEYGPILECASFGYETTGTQFQLKYICGFHVHTRSWYPIVDELKAGKPIDLELEELRSCVQYNFTFCAIFNVSNSFEVVPPATLPHCFCRQPVVMRYPNPPKGVFRFTCRNLSIDGAKKCTWMLPANEVAFLKPTIRLHTLLSEDEYMEKMDETRNQLLKPAEHKSSLLAALSGCQINDPVPPLPLPPPISLLFSNIKNNDLNNHTIHHQPIQKMVVPTSVISKQSAEPQLDMRESKTMASFLQTKEKMNQLQLEHERLKKQRREDHILMIHSQESLSKIESERVQLKHQIQNLTLELEKLQEENKTLMLIHEENQDKCTVCFTKSIDHCLIPCYHFAYCQSCAIKLSNCAICREPVKSIQKIYQC